MAVPITVAMQNQIAQNYIAILGRNPDPSGFAFWVQTYADANGTAAALTSITNGFGNSAEFKATYAGDPTQTAVGKLYQNVLLRAADTTGLTFWTNYANNLISSGQTISNAYAQTGAQMIYNASSQGSSDAAGINARTATAVTAGTAPPSTLYTLTTANETVTGNNLKIDGALTYASDGTGVTTGSTFTANDSISTGGSNNSLNLAITGGNAGTTFAAASVTGVQTFNLRNISGQTNSLDASTVSGLTAYNSDRSTAALTVTNLAIGASAGVIGNGTLTNGASNFGWTALATSGVVNVSGGVTAGTITTSGAGTVLTSNTVNSTGVANTLGALTLGANVTSLTINATTGLTTGAITNTTAAALTTLTINGAGAVDTSGGALVSTVTTVNAAGNSGGVTVLLGSAVTNKFTGGSGNDVVTTGAVLSTGTADGGAGTADVLSIGTNVAHVNTTTQAAKYTNFEILRIGAATLDVSVLGSAITGIQLDGAAVLTGMTATQAANVQARANIGNADLRLATFTGTSDVLTITNGLGTTTATAVNNATTIGTLVATGFETINLVANPSATATSGANRTTTVVAITDTSLTGVNLSGTAFTFGDIASTKAVAWNASTLTGNGASTPVGLTLSATGTAFAGSVVTGSALRDSVTMNSSTGVTFNLGAGNDIFSTTTTLLLPSGAATDNTVNAEAGATDQLIFTGAATATDTTFTKVSGFESLQLAGAGVSHSVTGLGAGFLGAYATGVTVTDTAAQNAANTYTWASGLYSQNVTLTHATAATLSAADSNQSITTGGGNDTITLTATAVVGAAGAAGNIAINTGAGADTITVDIGTNQILAVTGTRAVTITGGTGADIISVNATHVNALAVNLGNVGFVVAAGDSTTTAYDQITGFLKANGTNISDALDFASVTLTQYTATAVTGYTSAELTVAVSAAGVTTFAGTAASGLTVAQKISAVQSVVATNAGDSAFFIDNGNTYVFNNNSAGDSVVMLVGQTGATALITTNATTDLAIFIV